MAVALLAGICLLSWLGLRGAHPTRTSPLAETVRQPVGPVAASRVTSAGPGGAPAAERPAAYRLGAQRVLSYGNAEGEVGMVRGGGQPPVGPESFALGKDGGVLVADVVNKRVMFYDSNGAYLRSLSLPGIALGDIATDGQGRVYVYDQARRALHQYEADGTPGSTLDLNPRDIDTRGYFHVAGDALYFADAAARDVLVATLKDGVLVVPDPAAERVAEGVHGESGRIYSLSIDKGQGLRLDIRDPAAPSAVQSVQAPLPGIVSARFAGEDQARRSYVQTERLEGDRIILEVLAFGADGGELAATRMPENDYAIWTAKLVEVRGDGAIVQFLPQREQARLNLFVN